MAANFGNAAMIASRFQSCMLEMRNARVLLDINGGKLDRNGFMGFSNAMSHPPADSGVIIPPSDPNNIASVDRAQADVIGQQIHADATRFDSTIDRYEHGPNSDPHLDPQEQGRLGDLYDRLTSGKLSREQALAMMRGGSQGNLGCNAE